MTNGISFLSKKQESQKKWYQENKDRINKKARKERRLHSHHRERKNCKKCGKLMKRIDYISNIPLQVREGVWKRRIYCSELCAKKVAKESLKKYVTIFIHKDTKIEIMHLRYGKQTIDGVLKNLLENLRARHYGQEFIIGMQPNETPCIIKVLCLRDADKSSEIGKREKGDTFIAIYKEGDEIGKFWRNDEKFKIVNIIPTTLTPSFLKKVKE